MFVPPQRRRMGSWDVLGQPHSSGVHRFTEVLEKVPKVPEKVWEALFGAEPL